MEAQKTIPDDEFLEELEEAEEAPEIAPENAPEVASEGAFVDFKKRKTSRRLPPLLRLTRRANVFFSFTLLATIIFFVTGNKQTFLDSNMSLLLKIIACMAIALSFFSLSGIIECIFYTFADKNTKKIRLIFHLICYALIFAASLAVSILSLTINLLSEGIDF